MVYRCERTSFHLTNLSTSHLHLLTFHTSTYQSCACSSLLSCLLLYFIPVSPFLKCQTSDPPVFIYFYLLKYPLSLFLFHKAKPIYTPTLVEAGEVDGGTGCLRWAITIQIYKSQSPFHPTFQRVQGSILFGGCLGRGHDATRSRGRKAMTFLHTGRWPCMFRQLPPGSHRDLRVGAWRSASFRSSWRGILSCQGYNKIGFPSKEKKENAWHRSFGQQRMKRVRKWKRARDKQGKNEHEWALYSFQRSQNRKPEGRGGINQDTDQCID